MLDMALHHSSALPCRRQDEDDNMDEWDQEQLEKVVKQKHAAEASNKTDIICKFFLEAVEKKQYGWFWQCPNGGKDCKYRHALPPGCVSTHAHIPNTTGSLCSCGMQCCTRPDGLCVLIAWTHQIACDIKSNGTALWACCKPHIYVYVSM